MRRSFALSALAGTAVIALIGYLVGVVTAWDFGWPAQDNLATAGARYVWACVSLIAGITWAWRP